MIENWFERMRAAFLGVIVFVVVLSFMTTSCSSDADELPAEEQPAFEEGQTELTAKQRIPGAEQLISLAACHMIDGKDVLLKSTIGNTDYQRVIRLNTDDNKSFQYEFDFVQINNMVHYVAPVIDFPFLNETCGDGEIEVFITSFNTYLYADATKDKKHLRPYINEGLIVFRGDFGIYSCMDNSGSWEYDDMHQVISALTEYSSHKRFGENAIEKDFTPPLYQFFVKTENNITSLACDASNVVSVFPNQSSLEWTVLQGGDMVSSEDLFSAEELSVLPEMSQQCTIIDIGDNYFTVQSEYHLKKLIFDEYTLFFTGDQQAKPTDFAKGDMITVSFAKLYERYNPKVTTANKVVKN